MPEKVIFKWLKDDRYSPDGNAEPEEFEPVFFPVEVEVATSPVPALVTAPPGRIQIELPGGCRISAEGSFDVDLLVRLLKGLSS